MDKDGDTQQVEPEHQEAADWQYKPDAAAAPGSSSDSSVGGASVEWSASEFIAHEKGVGWYMIFAVAIVVAAGIVYLITREVFSAAFIGLLGVGVAIVAGRKPRTVPYRLDSSGVTIGRAFHPYGHYKSYSAVDEGPFTSIVLIPMRRFDFPLSMYLAPDIEHKALEALSSYLPLEPGKPDTLDRLMRYLRF